MFKLIIFLILVIINLSSQSVTFNNLRVIDGNEARPHSRPYQAGLIIWKGEHWWETQVICGGSILSTKIILTSGFCLYDSLRLQVRLGAHSLFQNEVTQQRFDLTSEDYFPHPEFSIDFMRHDVALLRLPRDAIFNSFVQPIELPNSEFIGKSFVGENIEVAGWGRFDDWTQNYSQVLRYSSNSIADISYCASKPLYKPLIFEETMCIETMNTRTSPCKGDHGSAVTWTRDDRTRRIIIGVFSLGKWWWNFGCKPGGIDISSYLNTDIRPYVDWIKGEIEKNQ